MKEVQKEILKEKDKAIAYWERVYDKLDAKAQKLDAKVQKLEVAVDITGKANLELALKLANREIQIAEANKILNDFPESAYQTMGDSSQPISTTWDSTNVQDCIERLRSVLNVNHTELTRDKSMVLMRRMNKFEV